MPLNNKPAAEFVPKGFNGNSNCWGGLVHGEPSGIEVLLTEIRHFAMLFEGFDGFYVISEKS